VTAYAIPGYRDADTYDMTGVLQVYTIDNDGTGTYYSSYTGVFNTA
jgi:hypothetical protein